MTLEQTARPTGAVMAEKLFLAAAKIGLCHVFLYFGERKTVENTRKDEEIVNKIWVFVQNYPLKKFQIATKKTRK